MRPALLICLLTLTVLAYGQKTKDHTVVVAEIAERIQSANFAKAPVRLAVVTFLPVQGISTSQNIFGDYVTESIIGKLATQTDKLKLFERNRIDAILKENEFMLSGMIKASEAIRIGELLPIDALFSGTYTKLKNYIDVTGRLIDVTSGEILMSYTGRIRLTKNIRTLFPQENPAQSGTTAVVLIASGGKGRTEPAKEKEDVEARCRIHTEKFQEKLHDLSTSDKVDALVREAIATPFENTCGKLHYHFINALSRYSLYPTAYQQFLLATLDTIAYPSGDDRAYSILSYLTKDKRVDDAEWKAGITTVRKVGDHTLSTYLSFLFNRVDDPDGAHLQRRADQYLDLLTKDQVGLPRPVGFDRGFYEMLEALSANQPLRFYLYERYGNRLATEPDNVGGVHLMYLKRMYGEEADQQKRTKIITWIADYFNKHTNQKSGEQLFDLAKDFQPYPNDEKSKFKIEKNEQAALEFPAADLALLVDRCREKFATYAVETPYPSQREDRINFCVRNHIPIPGVIPTIDEARAILKGNSIEDQHRVTRLLNMMGDHVAPLESDLIMLLEKRSLDNREMLADIQAMVLEILGTLRTKNQKAIAHMIASLKNYDKAGEISMEALASIGKPAVQPVIDQLNATTIHDGGLRYRLIVILGTIGRDAKIAAPTLRSLLAKNTNKDIQYAIEAALQAFGD